MSFGIAIFSWDQKIGAVLDKKYPSSLSISDALLNKVYMTHAYDEGSNDQELIKIDYQDKILLTYCDKSRVVDYGYELIVLILHQKENVGLFNLKQDTIEFGKKYFALNIDERQKFFEESISTFFKPTKPNKIVMIGRAGTGKTTIRKIVFEGANPQELLYNPIEPTRGISPSVYSWLDLDLGLFDTSGQELPQLLSDTSDQQLLFEGADILVYVCDFPSWAAKKDDIIEELKTVRKIINKIPHKMEFVVFLHKIDLIDKNEYERTTKLIKSTMKNELGISVYFTSIYPTQLYTTYNAFYDILSTLSDVNKNLKQIIDDEIGDFSKTMCFISNLENNIIAQSMNPDFPTQLINHTHKLSTQLNKSFENMGRNDNIQHLILKSENLSIIMKNLNLEKFNLKNAICISESISANNLIKLIGNIRLSLINYFYKIE